MQSISLTKTQQVSISATPKDATNIEAAVTSPVTFSNDSPLVVTVVQNVNPNTPLLAQAYAVNPGTAIVTLSGVNSLNQTVSSQFQINVVADPATHFDFTFGTPSAQ